MKKKLLITALVLMLTLCMGMLAGCGSKSEETTDDNAPAVEDVTGESEETPVTDAEPPAEDTEEPDEQPAATPFAPADVSDETIKTINTYDDYLVMCQKIIDDYIDNYEVAVKDTVLYDEKTFEDMKKKYADEFAAQKDQYSSFGDTALGGAKDTMVDYLITYRDTLKTYTDSIEEQLKALG